MTKALHMHMYRLGVSILRMIFHTVSDYASTVSQNLCVLLRAFNAVSKKNLEALQPQGYHMHTEIM